MMKQELNSIKDTWTKPKGLDWKAEAGMGGVGGHGRGEIETTVLEQQ